MIQGHLTRPRVLRDHIQPVDPGIKMHTAASTVSLHRPKRKKISRDLFMVARSKKEREEDATGIIKVHEKLQKLYKERDIGKSVHMHTQIDIHGKELFMHYISLMFTSTWFIFTYLDRVVVGWYFVLRIRDRHHSLCTYHDRFALMKKKKSNHQTTDIDLHQARRCRTRSASWCVCVCRLFLGSTTARDGSINFFLMANEFFFDAVDRRLKTG